MITESQITTLTGKTGIFTTREGLKVEVKIKNARSVFGREDVLITPIAGSHECWVCSDRVQLLKED